MTVVVIVIVFLVMCQLLFAMTHLQTTNVLSNTTLPFSDNPLSNHSSSSFQRVLYESEDPFFDGFVHYKDNWQHISNTTWSEPAPPSKHSLRAPSYPIVDYPIIPFFLRSAKPRLEDKITLVTQCSLNRFAAVKIMAARWDGIISLSIYIPFPPFRNQSTLDEDLASVTRLWHYMEHNTSAKLDVHVLFETESHQANYFTFMYPVNHLRNLALQTAQTDLVFLSDADFVPSTDFIPNVLANFDDAMQVLREKGSSASNVALVIPAFEMTKNTTELTPKVVRNLHTTKSGIRGSCARGHSMQFHLAGSRFAHGPTDYSRWMDSSTLRPYRVEYEEKYEPYVVVKRQGLRRYDARFRGYGRNKVMQLRALDVLDRFEWMVAPDCFMYHIPHALSSDRKKFRTHGRYVDWIEMLEEIAKDEMSYQHDATGKILT